jgi:micrococcal nuclease
VSGTAALIVGLVIAIADGDTLTVLDSDFKQVKVRLAEIDAPESKQPFGTRARQSLGELCHEKRAEVRVTDRDRYGRIVGRVTCDGTDANSTQVHRGLAWVYDRYAKDATLYRLQDEARAAGRGLWTDSTPVAPWAWRAVHRGAAK